MKYLLYPISLLYGAIMDLRNFLFDHKLLRSESFCLPILSVGNITVGGTGKTPHVEYLIRLLQQQAYRIAVLSRGYGRRTKGFIMLSTTAHAEQVGDEPLQIKLKYPDVTVAVDEKRVDGVNRLLESDPTIETIVLDDAFQHRYIKPSLSILLIDHARPIDKDMLLPAGHLREAASGIGRADIVIISKCPPSLIPSEHEAGYRRRLRLRPEQQLYFTSICYDQKLKTACDNRTCNLSDISSDAILILVTGIASPTLLYNEMKQYFQQISLLTFPDHHKYSINDMRRIQHEWEQAGNRPKYIVTTEKDVMRFREGIAADYSFYRSLYYLPIQIVFKGDGAIKFNQTIYNHVSSHQRNSRIHT